MKNVLVLLSAEARHRAKLEAAGAGCRLIYVRPEEVTPDMVREADAILGLISPKLLPAAEHLAWLQLESAGTDPYIAPGVLREETVLTNASGAYNQAVAAGYQFRKRNFEIFHDYAYTYCSKN